MGTHSLYPGAKVALEKPVKYDKRRYKRRNRIEIRFGRLEGLEACRNPLRSRLSKAFLSAIALAATVLFWL